MVNILDRAAGVVKKALGINPQPEPEHVSYSHGTSDGTRQTEELFGMGSANKIDALMREWTKSAEYLHGHIVDQNPDDLILEKGNSVAVYQDMRRDPYVKAGLNTKKVSVARLTRRILPASSDPIDQEIAKFIEHNLENMETSFDQALWGMMDAVDCGFSIGEQNYKVIDRGRWAGKVGLKSIKSKDTVVYTFQINKTGDVERVVQNISSGIDDDFQHVVEPPENENFQNNFGHLSFPPEKFVICSFMPLYSNPYGNSDLRAAFRAFFIKDWAWKFRSIFMEKSGLPTVVGRFPNGILEARRKRLEEILDSIQTDTVITIPDDLKIEILNIAGKGQVTEYERAIADLNKEILIGILGSFLSAEEGKRTGARAQGQVHFNVAKLFMEHLAKMMSECVNRQIIKRLVDINYNVDEYPKFSFEISRADEMKAEIEIDKVLKMDLSVPLDNSYFYEKYGRPAPEESAVDSVLGRDAGLPPDPNAPPDPNLPVPPPDPVPPPGDTPPPAPGSPPEEMDEDPFNTPHNVSELKRLRENFIILREDALPKDPKKIGPLKDVYGWFFKQFEATTGRKKFAESADRAFRMAGRERKHFEDKGHWVDSSIAWAEFLKEGFRA